MEEFAALFTALDEAASADDKVDALARYFAAAPPADAAWALFFLWGRRLPQAAPARLLRQWAVEEGGVPAWLFEECYAAVGDLAETIALLVEPPTRNEERGTRNEEPPAGDASALIVSRSSLVEWVEQRLIPLRGAGEAERRAAVARAWRDLGPRERLVWNRLLGGALRAPVSQPLVARALARAGSVEPATIAHRLAGDWAPTPEFFARLLGADSADASVSQPFPFCLAAPLDEPPEALGPVEEWQAEWLWDGLRAQLVRRGGATFLWSRGDELIAERFPEVAALGAHLLDGTVLDGAIVPWRDGAPLPLASVQGRLGGAAPSKRQPDGPPVALLAFDLLEHEGVDIRPLPLRERRARLEALLGVEGEGMRQDLAPLSAAEAGQSLAPPPSFSLHPSLLLSPLLPAPSWEALAERWAASRERGVDGLVLKRRAAPYEAGRGDWLAWKGAPHRVVVVLLYAQRGSGARANLYSDYTFGVWHEGKLVPFAKADAGLSDAETRKVDAFVRRNTLERFGPVRTVEPALVFELAFEGVRRSPRHKSGVAVRSARIVRPLPGRPAAEAATLDEIRALLPPE
jgi:DNA ligase-1